MYRKMAPSCNLRVGLSRNYKSSDKEKSADVNTSVKEIKTPVSKVVMLSSNNLRVGLSRNYKSNAEKLNSSINFDASPSYSPLDGKYQINIDKTEAKGVNKSLFQPVTIVSNDLSGECSEPVSFDGNLSKNVDSTLNKSQINSSDMQGKKEQLNQSARKSKVPKIEKKDATPESNRKNKNNSSVLSEKRISEKSDDGNLNQRPKRNTKRRKYFDEDSSDKSDTEQIIHNESKVLKNSSTKKSRKSRIRSSEDESDVEKMDQENSSDRTGKKRCTRNRKVRKYFDDDSSENELDDEQDNKKVEILKSNTKRKIKDDHKIVVDNYKWANFETVANDVGVSDNKLLEDTSEILGNNSNSSDETFKNGCMRSEVQSNDSDVGDLQGESQSVEIPVAKPINSPIHAYKNKSTKGEKIESFCRKPSKNKLSLKRKSSSFQSVESSPDKLSKWSQDSQGESCQLSPIKNDVIPSPNKDDQSNTQIHFEEYSETRLKVLEQAIKCKKTKLDDLQRAELYHKMHDVKELTKLTKTWKSGCQNALSDLLSKVREHDKDIQMPSLLSNLGITAENVGYSLEDEDFV